MKFGLFPSPRDERDVLLTTYLKDEKLPESYTINEGDISPVRSQGQEGACVGFAMVTGVKEYQEKIDQGSFITLSPRFLYEEAKKISGHKEGTTLRAAMQVASRFGVCEEKYWPYQVPQETTIHPNAYIDAFKYRIKTYARVSNLEELKGAIVQFGMGIIGVEVFKGMVSDKAKMTGVVDDPTCWNKWVGGSLGGHALAPVAYENKSPYFDNDGHIKVKNSWGKGYGDKGYLYLSYRYITANMMDAFSCVDRLDPNSLRVGDLDAKEKEELWV